MIPPSLFNANFLFTLVPIWEPEPVPADDPAATPTEANSESATQPGGDADGINDQVALRMVFKGYKLGVMTDYQAEHFSGYDDFVQNRADDDEERQRRDERARNALRPNPHAASGPEQAGTAPSAPSDTE